MIYMTPILSRYLDLVRFSPAVETTLVLVPWKNSVLFLSYIAFISCVQIFFGWLKVF